MLNLCAKCEARRGERKEVIQEIVDTEVSYGKDLKVIKEVCLHVHVYHCSRWCRHLLYLCPIETCRFVSHWYNVSFLPFREDLKVVESLCD